MPYLNTIGGGSARKFGFTRRSQFYKCLSNTSIVTFNLNTLQCIYPPNYAATPFYYQCVQTGCWSGGGVWGTDPITYQSNPILCCSCLPNANGNPCFGLGCQCYSAGWIPDGTSSGGCYQAYPATVTCTGYSCPTNSPPATLSGTTCVYPPTYSATLVDA